MRRQKPTVPAFGRSRRGTGEQPLAVSERIAKSLLVCRETELKSKNIKVPPPADEAPARRSSGTGRGKAAEGEDEGDYEVRYLTPPPVRDRGGRGVNGRTAGAGPAAPAPASVVAPRKKKRTSVRLPIFMWEALDDICYRERLSIDDISELIGERIEWTVKDRESRRSDSRQEGDQGLATSLSTAIRIFILAYYRALAEEVDRMKPGYQACGEARVSRDDPDGAA